MKALVGFVTLNWKSDPQRIATTLELMNFPRPKTALRTDFENNLAFRVQANAARNAKLGFSFQIFPCRTVPAFIRILPQHLRAAVLKLLLSNHHFLSETELWEGIPAEELLCPWGKTLSYEGHALFTCPAYQDRREQLLKQLRGFTNDAASPNDL